VFQLMDQGIIRGCKAYYRGDLLGWVVNCDLQVTEFLKTLTLKDVAYSVGLAWRKITPTTIENCWNKIHWNRWRHGRRDEINSIFKTRRESWVRCTAY
jgi:hypothetical protein